MAGVILTGFNTVHKWGDLVIQVGAVFFLKWGELVKKWGYLLMGRLSWIPFKYILMWFLASSCINTLIAIVELIVFFKIVDKIALTKFPFGSLELDGGNTLQILTVGRYGHQKS